MTGYSAYWIGQLAKRYNEHGPAGMYNRQHTTSRRAAPLLSAELQEELRQALAGPASENDRWSGRIVAEWMSVRLGRPVSRYRGCVYLQRYTPRPRHGLPRPRHALADHAEQEAFKKVEATPARGGHGLFERQRRAVGPGDPDEHRIGLKPLLRRVWRWLVGFVHPASGRTIFHLATAVSIELFEVELAAFAQQVGAGPTKQIVLVLDQAGWHTGPTLRMPEHVHLLCLPPHSPELQLAEHLWPLTNTVLINPHVADPDELEDAQAHSCVALQRRRDLIRSATRFHWWPLRIKKRQGRGTVLADPAWASFRPQTARPM